MAPRPPERIQIGDDAVVVRPRVEHAEALAAAVAASLDHLRPWMPWADDEAATAGFQRERLAGVEAGWDAGEDFSLLILDPTEQEVLGATGLHLRQGPGVLEIGYWLRPDATGKGLMTRVAAALTEAAFELDGIDEVQIRCDPANVASAAVARRLGYDLTGEVDGQQVWVAPGRRSG